MGSVLGFPGIDPMDAALDLTPEALRRVEAGREHLDSASLDAATRALRLPVWALVSDTPGY